MRFGRKGISVLFSHRFVFGEIHAVPVNLSALSCSDFIYVEPIKVMRRPVIRVEPYVAAVSERSNMDAGYKGRRVRRVLMAPRGM